MVADLPAGMSTPEPVPSDLLGTPGPSGAATPSPPPPATHGGPIQISVFGNLLAGQSLSNTGFGQNTSQSTANAGAEVDLTRRTPNTATRLSLPTNFGNSGSQLGQLTAEHDTPKASYFYGPQTIGALGIIQIGQTQRGLSVLIPRGNTGDLLFYTGATAVANPTYNVTGARMRFLTKRGSLFAVGAYDARAEGVGGTVAGLVGGYATATGKFDAQLEGAFTHNSQILVANSSTGAQFVPAGNSLTFQGRSDYGTGNSYASVTFRDLPPNFISLGGTSLADRDVALAFRSLAGKSAYTITAENDRYSSGNGELDAVRNSFTWTQPFKHGASLLFSLQSQTTTQPTDSNWSGSLSTSFNTALRGTVLTSGFSLARTTDAVAGENSSETYQVGASRTYGQLGLSLTASNTRQTGLSGTYDSTSLTFGAGRTWGKTSISEQSQISRTYSPGSALTQLGPGVAVTRRISNAIVATVNGTYTYRHDAILSSNDSHGAQFSFNLSAPFSIGTGVVTGRANPKLPGTIQGVVQNDATAPGFAQAQSGLTFGGANIAVVLDNAQVARTDVQGRFQFPFIAPGRHEITIDPASLPRGIQPASPITVINLQGGTVTNVVLSIGAYGAIDGRILAGDQPAAPGIAGVAVTIDGHGRAVTGPNGTFGFGGLAAGPHTVAIVQETLPASFGSLTEYTKQVDVVTGTIAHVKFVGAPLASIAGTVKFAHPANPQAVGVENAYVVAQPGDHAAIVELDGSYLLDNLPAGDYTLSVDPETLPDGMGVTSDKEVQFSLKPGQHAENVNFLVGDAEKNIVFTFKGAEANTVEARALTTKLPPLGSTTVYVTTSSPVTTVVGHVFGTTTTLTYDAAHKRWIGTVVVPIGTPKGPATSVFEAQGKNGGSAEVRIDVDPAIPLYTVALQPPNPAVNQYVHVRMHVLADVTPKTKITWQDGTQSVLGTPKSGRYYEFDVKVTAIPFRGTIATENGIPIVLVK